MSHDHSHFAPSRMPGVVVPSDDFQVERDGVIYHPHAGEWIMVSPEKPIGLLLMIEDFKRLAVEEAQLEGEPDENERKSALLAKTFEMLLPQIANLIEDWSWTNRRGERLPSPYGNPDVIRNLTAEEINYLMTAAGNDAPAARKNGSSGSASTSSGSAPQLAPVKSSTGRSRTRAS